jgi:uncharacterized protein
MPSGFFYAPKVLNWQPKSVKWLTMSKIIDFHTHAFPDNIALRAMKALQEGCSVQAHLDGTLAALLKSMDSCGIEKSVVCNIATKPSQFDSIMAWSKQIRSERIIPIPSVHPDDPQCVEHIKAARAEGFAGIKMHPFYQDFFIDEERVFKIYEQLCREDMFIVMHTGFDIAFEYIRRADPAKIAAVVEKFPGLKFVSTHFGAWDDWQEVTKRLIGRKVYLEISLSMEFMEIAAIKTMILAHPADHIIFGTDSPWGNQCWAVEQIRKMGLGEEREEKLLYQNGLKLLGL